MMKKYFTLIMVMVFALCSKAMAEETVEKSVAWSSPANYYAAALDANYDCTIEAYTDGTYAVKGIYGSEYDLEFTVDMANVINGVPEVVLTNYYSASAPYYYYHAGSYIICVYYATGSGYTGWEGDTDAPGLWFYVYLYDTENNYINAGYDYITWSKESITGIADIQAADIRNNGTLYSLSGIRCDGNSKPGKGIYIKNGKKIIIK